MEQTLEQQRCVGLFSQGESLRISAYAGSGKTTTLKLLAKSTERRGLYLAYNHAIAKEAKGTFPSTVACSTSHALAFKGVQSRHGLPAAKLTDSANAHLIADALQLPNLLQISQRCTIPRTSYGAFLRLGCNRFFSSSDNAPSIEHFPRHHGSLVTFSDEQFREFACIALLQMKKLWRLMCSPKSHVSIGHDGYLKLWALSKPRLTADYIMLDEAQDSNPAILGVLAAQPCQVVYVGDPYQQIYEWRGAVDAMSRVKTPNHALLSQSFRFGPRIADAATRIIAHLGATNPVFGNPVIDSHLAEVLPDALLCRGNAGVIASLLSLLSKNVRCHIVGGTQELENLLKEVGRLKRGIPSIRSELFGFASWREIQEYSDAYGDAGLKKLVKLVDEYGEDRLLTALGRCEPQEAQAEIILSTVHKAKGREWNHVEISRDFERPFEEISDTPRDNPGLAAELRLLYVAVTRARLALNVPPAIKKFLRLDNTIAGKQGSRGSVVEVVHAACQEIATWSNQQTAIPSINAEVGLIEFKLATQEAEPVTKEVKTEPIQLLRSGTRVKHRNFGEGVLLEDGVAFRIETLRKYDQSIHVEFGTVRMRMVVGLAEVEVL